MSILGKPYLPSHPGREGEGEAALLLWLCPHTCVTLDQARVMFLYRPPDAKGGYTERLRTCHDSYCTFEVNSSVKHSFHDQHTLTLRTCLTLLLIQGCEDYHEASERFFTVRRVGLALSRLKFPICRHITTEDSYVLEHFTPSCFYSRDDKNGEYLCSHTGKQHYRQCFDCRDRGCYTAFGFRSCPTSWDGTKNLLLQLDVYRDLGCMENSHTPGWRCHAYGKGKIDQLAQDWRLWIDSIGQQELIPGRFSNLGRIANFLADKLGIFKPTSSSMLSTSPQYHSQQPGSEGARRSDMLRGKCIPRRKCVLTSCRYGNKEIRPSARGGFRC